MMMKGTDPFPETAIHLTMIKKNEKETKGPLSMLDRYLWQHLSTCLSVYLKPSRSIYVLYMYVGGRFLAYTVPIY